MPFRFLAVNCSYLDVPRIHFAGRFRADVNTRNNWPCNFDYDVPIYDDAEWNSNGTGEWEFLDTHITTVIDAAGNSIASSPLVGGELFSNNMRPLAKLVDLDVDFQISTLYGLKLGLRVNNETWFIADWSPSVLPHDMWFKMKCYDETKLKRDAELGASSTSRLVNITWLKSDLPPIFQNLTQCSDCTGDLSVAISYHFYNQKEFTVGEIIGTIGAAKAGEPLNLGGDRKLISTHQQNILTFPPEHICTKYNSSSDDTFTNVAPFIVDKARSMLVVDISNVFPVDITNKPIDLGSLWFGILTQDKKVVIIGEEIPYRDETLIRNHGGVIEQQLYEHASYLDSSLLVIVKDVSESHDQLPTGYDSELIYHVKDTFPSLGSGHKVMLMCKEMLHYVRPMDHFMDRLEYTGKTSSSVTFKVSTFGRPSPGATVRVHAIKSEVVPKGGVAVYQDAAQTTESGYASFTFEVQKRIPEKRHYTSNPCPSSGYGRKYSSHPIREDDSELGEYELPIDGQVYSFYYCVDSNSICSPPDLEGDAILLSPTIVTMLAFSTVDYQKPYTWVNHTKHIFHQMHHLHHIMSTVLNLKNYTEVTLPRNIELLRMSFTKDFNDPNYMPVTRDLSPTKLKMIMEWLNRPCYDSDCGPWPPSGEVPATPICRGANDMSMNVALPDATYFRPPRCDLNISHHKDPEMTDTYFRDIFRNKHSVDDNIKIQAAAASRPLFGFLGVDNSQGETKETAKLYNYVAHHLKHRIHQCSLDDLKRQLQTATELEFTTIPLYLTALYSIVQDCNVEAYQLIRTVVMQEMLHYAQAANLLISVGGKVVLDTNETVPKYPRKGLPGGVLPNLHISLKKFTLDHVYYTFMGIETPTLQSNLRADPQYELATIGQFYREIKLCMKHLSRKEDIFVGDVNKQVQWPWTDDDVGEIYNVTDIHTAVKAIENIIEQGEGASRNDPTSGIPGQFAHFYSFEEIVCQKRLEETQNGYSYSGPRIPYNPNGVWPMRDNPGKRCIQPNTPCHTEARAFHQVYRNFLRVMQETVDGRPEKIIEAVPLMESLLVHAKKVMWTPYDDFTTCGPVWDYEWDYEWNYN